MTFEEWWSEQPTRFVAAGFKDDASEIWDAATKAEREACANVCDQAAHERVHKFGNYCAAMIRARSNE